ncbi:sugar nucleotide-binding protein, partial [Klebsiella pneumoniae]|uniref:sugar nucleotide-binding protein n=1 Tax=Klebsiella pneumoniae TaxID=573 RepID=UPI0030135ABE
PLSAYGRSKLAGERSTAESNPRHFVVRSSWLFGPGGRNFVETMLGLGPEVRVVDDQVGCPTFTGHLAEALVRLAGEGGAA